MQPAQQHDGYRRLLRYALPYWRGWLGIAAVTLLSAAFALLQPWPMSILVDHVLGDVPRPDWLRTLVPASSVQALLAFVVIGGLVVFIINSILDVVLTMSWLRVGQAMVYDVARDMFSTIQRRSLAFHNSNSVGELMGRITGDSWCANTLVNTIILAPVHAVVMLLGMVVVMAQMDLQLTFWSLAVAPMMAASSWLLGSPMRTAARVGRETQTRIHAHVQQTLTGMPVVQAFAQEDREYGRFLEFAGQAVRAQQRVTVVQSAFNLGSGFFTTMGTAVVLWIGARHVLRTELTLGALLVFLSYLTSLQAQIKTLTGTWGLLQQTGASVDRVMEILDADEPVRDRPGAREVGEVRGRVDFQNVTFGYQPGQELLRRINLTVEPGQTLAIVGPTGAGKTTLVSMVPRFLDPWEGTVRLDGTDLRELKIRSLRSNISLVLQEPFLSATSIAENILVGRPEATREEIVEAARLANALPFIEQLPEGFETVIGERGMTLSGGERQRISIARALLKNAPILILDEPTSALDVETESLLLEALNRLMQGRTTFIIAHRLSTIRRADRIAVLREGRVAEFGTHEELLKNNALYSELQRWQSGEKTP